MASFLEGLGQGRGGGKWVKTSVLDLALSLTSDVTSGILHLGPVNYISSTVGIQWFLQTFPDLILYVHGNLYIANSLFPAISGLSH